MAALAAFSELDVWVGAEQHTLPQLIICDFTTLGKGCKAYPYVCLEETRFG